MKNYSKIEDYEKIINMLSDFCNWGNLSRNSIKNFCDDIFCCVHIHAQFTLS